MAENSRQSPVRRKSASSYRCRIDKGDRHEQRSRFRNERCEVPADDAVGHALEVVGWITLGLALALALLVFLARVGSADTTGTGTVVAIAAVGGLQSLLLVGCGRLV